MWCLLQVRRVRTQVSASVGPAGGAMRVGTSVGYCWIPVEETTFPDGSPFFDYKHGETGALSHKAQHPEFELWSQRIHARSGVSCADCHMPYQRVGAAKLSSHNVRSPLENINASCQNCHHQSENELRERVETIQSRHLALLERSGKAVAEMLDAVVEARAAGHDDEALQKIYELQRKAMWRLDYISSEKLSWVSR